ncbi:MAG TPA: hypothetical protein PKV98_04470 [Burkholderiaceae bacterium]|nr:hypothetical protein [Burkholderiaceae bacterium]
MNPIYTRGMLKPEPPAYAPGPWKACRSHEDYNGPMWELDEDERADYDARPFVRIEASDGSTVTTAHDLFEFKPANAALVQAAPKLYEALAAIVDGYNSGTHEAVLARIALEALKEVSP